MDLTNRKFGRLTVVAQHSKDTQGRTNTNETIYFWRENNV